MTSGLYLKLCLFHETQSCSEVVQINCSFTSLNLELLEKKIFCRNRRIHEIVRLGIFSVCEHYKCWIHRWKISIKRDFVVALYDSFLFNKN